MAFGQVNSLGSGSTSEAGMELSRAQGVVAGMLVGDALAMPVHWYYSIPEMDTDYGRVTAFLPPKPTHPDSHKYMPQEGNNPNSVIGRLILKGKRKQWQTVGTHYHRDLKAGENTLNLQCLLLFLKNLDVDNYERTAFLDHYVSFMTTEKSHNDTYAELYHRQFFEKLDQGLPLDQCAGEERNDTACSGGFTRPIGLAVALLRTRAPAALIHSLTLDHLRLTHRSPKLERHWEIFLSAFLAVYAKDDQALFDRELRKALGHWTLDLDTLLTKDDREIIGDEIKPTCYIENGLAAVFVLALKYKDNLRAALEANVYVGGDSCHRGAVLGALIAGAFGPRVVPKDLYSNLYLQPDIQAALHTLA